MSGYESPTGGLTSDYCYQREGGKEEVWKDRQDGGGKRRNGKGGGGRERGAGENMCGGRRYPCTLLVGL